MKMAPHPQRHTPVPSSVFRTVVAVALVTAVAALGLVGCTNDDNWAGPIESSTSTVEDHVGPPAVVASTSWVAAIARAAGIDEVTVIAPLDLQHPNDYDPKPSDLAAVADADYVLVSGFEAFADRMTEATGSDARTVRVNTVNTPETVTSEVRKIASIFGTDERAEQWLAAFDETVGELRSSIDSARPTPAPTAVVQKFMAPWAEFAGITTVGTYGPAPVSAADLARFRSDSPALILDNAHVPVGGALDDLGATKVELVNFPPDSLDLIDVFKENTRSIIDAFGKL